MLKSVINMLLICPVLVTFASVTWRRQIVKYQDGFFTQSNIKFVPVHKVSTILPIACKMGYIKRVNKGLLNSCVKSNSKCKTLFATVKIGVCQTPQCHMMRTVSQLSVYMATELLRSTHMVTSFWVHAVGSQTPQKADWMQCLIASFQGFAFLREILSGS